MHDFKQSLEKSNESKLKAFWLPIYKEAFGNFVQFMACDVDCKIQRQGIDRVIILDNGRALYIDEKVRYKEYNDVFLEITSVDNTGALGWMEKDLAIDYLAYAFIESKTCYLFDWRMLRRAWKYYKDKWVKEYGTRTVPNNGYNTIGVPVPISVLLDKVSGASKITV